MPQRPLNPNPDPSDSVRRTVEGLMNTMRMIEPLDKLTFHVHSLEDFVDATGISPVPPQRLEMIQTFAGIPVVEDPDVNPGEAVLKRNDQEDKVYCLRTPTPFYVDVARLRELS